SGVPATDIRIGGIAGSGNVTIYLDAVSSFDGGASWSTPVGCAGGIIGLGAPTPSPLAANFKCDNYYGSQGGIVSTSKNTCSCGCDVAIFRANVRHEVGHVLGLGHPDKGQSVHSTTTTLSDWLNAVMASNVPPGKPSTPQADDIQARQYYYPVGDSGGLSADFGFTPASPVAGQPIQFTDRSTGGPTTWSWNFADGATSTSQNPVHAFLQAGTYQVSLTVTNRNGRSSRILAVIVRSGGPFQDGPLTIF